MKDRRTHEAHDEIKGFYVNFLIGKNWFKRVISDHHTLSTCAFV